MDGDRACVSDNDPHLEEPGVTGGADQHGETLVEFPRGDRVVEGVKHVIVSNAVFACTLGDERPPIHDNKLLC